MELLMWRLLSSPSYMSYVPHSILDQSVVFMSDKSHATHEELLTALVDRNKDFKWTISPFRLTAGTSPDWDGDTKVCLFK